MGLDMYLEKAERNMEGELVLKEIFYWRKAYPIMDWFEAKFEGIHNCARYNLEADTLLELRNWLVEVVGSELGCVEEGNWTSSNELEDFDDYHLDWCKSTLEFLNSLDLSNDNCFYMLHAWW